MASTTPTAAVSRSLAIAAHIPSREIGSGYFQETHPEHLFRDCSHYCELISQPQQMPRVLEIAIRTALARRGVAVAGVLNEARRVTILGGAGCAGAHAELIEAAEKLKAPIVHALRGKEFIEYDNP